MQLDMDCIQFESRREIEDIIIALDTYLKEHKRTNSVDTVKKLANLLNVMHMNW